MCGSLSLLEVFGLDPLALRLRQGAFALRGDEYTPRSKFDLTSLKLAEPRIALGTWFGKKRDDRRTPIMNLFNHDQTPIEEGWSVRKRQVRDFRGRTLTYDSHNGTDFAIPLGTNVTTPAPGLVVRVSNEFHRGGLKVIVDHGNGLMTTCNHLARSLVEVGETVGRGQRIGLAGASGLDMVAGFPWIAPHVHFNVWLNGEPVDPFASPGEVSIWRTHNDPTPCPRAEVGSSDGFSRSKVSSARLSAAIATCRDEALRSELQQRVDPYDGAMELIFQQNYYPTRFTSRLSPFEAKHLRKGCIDLPFEESDFVGTVFSDVP